MRRLWTATSLALSCAAFTLAYPQPSSQDTQQHVLMPLLPPRSSSSSSSSSRRSGSRSGCSSSNIINSGSDMDTYARFDGEQVLRVHVSSLPQLKRLEALVEDHNLDLWSNLRIGSVDVRVPVSKIDVFEATMYDIPSSVLIPNLQDLVPQQQPAASSLYTTHNDWDFTNNSFWLNYHDIETLNNFTEAMAKRFPDLVKRVSIGQTYEDREVYAISIHGYKAKERRSGSSSSEDGIQDEQDDEVETDLDRSEYREGQPWWSWLFSLPRWGVRKPSKPKKHPKAIVIQAGQHAREWIGPAVVTYIAKELILGYQHSKKITRLVDQFEFVIVPVLNADGYAYTWESNRMWRKNRQPTSIPLCPGIDPNRNWGYMWNKGGSSANPCNEGYHGPEAFAALEAKMMADFILERKNVIAYIDFHAYSQLWMSPFGGDCNEIPRDDEDIMEGALGAVKALHGVHGKRFAVGSICNVIYQASGGSIDWTYAEGKVKYSYGVELRDTGRYGFLLPETEILPSSEETFAGVMYLANFIRKREKQWGYMA